MLNKAITGKRKWTMAALLTAGLMLLLAACTNIATPASATEPTADTPAQAEPVSTPSEETVEPETSAPEGTMETLTFAVQQSTFLSAIQNAVGEMGAPDARYYVELSADNGTWQGERLVYPDREVWFLQQEAGGGDTAVRLDVSVEADEDAVLALLPQMEAPAGDAPNVDIQFVRARRGDAGQWSFDVTEEYPDTGWEDYADGWQVETPDGEILGVRILVHPHVGEQPFTRSLGRVIVPAGVKEVRIRPHDLVSGYGPAAVALPLEEAGTGDLYEVIR